MANSRTLRASSEPRWPAPCSTSSTKSAPAGMNLGHCASFRDIRRTLRSTLGFAQARRNSPRARSRETGTRASAHCAPTPPSWDAARDELAEPKTFPAEVWGSNPTRSTVPWSGTSSGPVRRCSRAVKKLATAFAHGSRSDCRVDVYEGTHHFAPPQRLQPELFARALREHWARGKAATRTD